MGSLDRKYRLFGHAKSVVPLGAPRFFSTPAAIEPRVDGRDAQAHNGGASDSSERNNRCFVHVAASLFVLTLVRRPDLEAA